MTETKIKVRTTLGVTDHNLLDNRFIDNQHTINAISGLEEALESKQNVLTAGENIEISEEGVISATDTTYTAGENVEISEEGVISATDTTYTAGTNVSIDNGVISAVDTTYTAGENVSIENGVISAVDTTYTAGTGIDITNGVISNTQTSAEWGNIGGNINSQTDLKNAFDAKANSADLAAVATSGSYTDLSGTPTLATVATSGLYSDLSGTPTLATVATSGDYDDLTNKPTIPTITDTYSRVSHDGMSGIAVASAINSAIASVYKPAGSSTFAELPPLAAGIEGYVFNMTDDFTTTSDFVDGAGKDYPAGTNIVCILTRDGYKWDVLAGIVDLSGYQTLIDSSHKLNSDLVDDTNATNKFVTASDKTTWNAKQDTLTAGSNITISGNTISATDTTYSTFTGATGSVAGSAGLVPAPTTNDVDSYLKGDGTWQSGIVVNNATSGNLAIGPYSEASSFNTTAYGRSSNASGMNALALGYYATAKKSNSIQLGQGTNNTADTFQVGSYTLLDTSTGKIPNDRLSAFTGATSSVDGSSGLVPAPTTSDVDKYLKGDGTWAEAGGSVSYDSSTINENSSNELQAIGIKEARTDTAIRFWHGTEAQYNNGESQTYYNWTHSNGSAVEGNWTDVTLPASANWMSVCYGNGKYVAVASNSTTAIYSTNGTSWNSATLPASASWSSVCYGNGRFVAVSNGSTSAAYSTDGGETWMEATMPTGRRWRGVCYGNGKFIAVGNGGYYATSTDGGETWTEAQFTTGESGTYYSVCYGNGKFVAIQNESSVSKVSTDGINWTNATLPGNRMLWVSLAFGAKGFVAVANYYKVGAYSADGETWEQITLSDTINHWTSVCYGNGKFVAVSQSTDKVAVSTDGKNWSEETVAAASKSFNTITYGGGKFITLVASSTEEYYKESATASNSVYTTDATPTTASTVYYSTTIIADLTITAVGSGTITLSDGNTYTYDSTGDQTVTYSVGELHPNYICNIDGVGVKIGNTFIADYSAPAIGDIDTTLTAIIAQGS